MTDTPEQMLQRFARFLDQGAERLGIVGGSPRVVFALENAKEWAGKHLRSVSANPAGREPKVAYAEIRRAVRTHLARKVPLKRALSLANDELKFCANDASPQTLDKAWRRALASETTET